MEDVIIKPQWSKFETENSQIIANFFSVQKIDHNSQNFKINSLRDYYRLDRIDGSILIDELTLRGYEFRSAKQNHFFPENCEASMIIKANNNLERYKKINFFILGLGGFVSKYKISSDQFFDYIPIEGFLRLNKYISKDMLINEFKNAGFNIENLSKARISLFDVIKESEFPKLITTIKKENINTIKDFCNNYETLIRRTQNLNKYDIQRIKLIANWFDEEEKIKDIREITVLEYFRSNDKGFLKYCEKNNISRVCELINDDNVERYSKHTITYVNTFIDYLKTYYYMNLNEQIENISIHYIPGIGTTKTISSLNTNGINTIKDLLIADLSKVDGLGKGKIKNINNVLIDFINNPEIPIKKNQIIIPCSLYNIKIEDLFCDSGLGVSSFRDYCKKNQIIYVKDLKEYDLKIILKSINMLGKVKANEIINKVTNPNYNVESPQEMLRVMMDEFVSDNKELYSIVYERNINHKTLEELGNEKNVTKERIRQLEAKALSMLRGFSNILFDVLNSDMKLVCISEQILNEIFNNSDYSKILFNLIKYRDEVYYNENFPKVFIKNNIENLDDFFVSIGEFLDGSYDDSKEILTKEDIKNYIENCISRYSLTEYIDFSDCEKLIETSNYKAVGDVWLKKGIYVHDIYLSILKDYYPNGVKFDEANCEDIRNKYNELTGEKTDISDRNLTAKLQREKEVIICGPNSYIHVENVRVQQQMLETIYKYIHHLFEHEGLSSVYTDKIYNVFKDELNIYGVDNYVFLYGILRYNFIDEFEFNNFWITKNGKGDVTRELALIDYLKRDTNYNVGIPKEKIISLFGLSGPYLINIIYYSDEIKECHNKENLIYEGNYRISDILLEKIRSYVNENIYEQLGFISIKHLLNKFDIYLEQEGIIDELTLSDVLKKYLIDYYIKDLYVCLNKVEDYLDEYFFFNLFAKEKESFTRKEFELFAKEKGIYDNRIYDVLKNKFCDLYQINVSDFVLNIEITNENIEDIYEIIDKNINNKKYLLLSDLKKNGDIFRMPNLGFSWNEYLLRTILLKNMKENYIMIDVPGAQLFTERGILVKKELEIDNYIDFLKYVYMENRYYELESVNQLYKTLQANGLINETFPAEFKKNVVDEYGRLIRC